MFRNQYLVVPGSAKLRSLKLIPVRFDDLLIYAHSSLNVSLATWETVKIALIGYVINPLNPADSNEKILEKLAKQCSTLDIFLQEVQILSGRYVMLFKTDSSFIVSGDACHLRQMYYGFPDGRFVLTSSPKLFLDAFNYSLKMSKAKSEVVNLPIFLNKESMWYGEQSFDDRLHKLLPNHYLDIKAKKKKRLPIFPRDHYSNEEQILEYASLILRNTFTTLNNRYKLILPLTAGLDSRVLLAASRNFNNKIQYYVFDPLTKNSADVWVPDNLSKKCGLQFKIIKPGELRSDFLEKYEKEHLFPRVLSKTAHIQHHYDAYSNQNVININGNCAEIARGDSGFTRRNISIDMVLTFSKYQGKIPYFNEQLEKWYLDAGPYAQDYGIPLMDLFYWEQRLGNWHGLWQTEQDIAIEEISPFNNRSLINALIQVEPKKRKIPHYHFFKKLAHHLWEEVMSEPINPGGNYLQKVIKGNSLVKYWSVKAKNLLQKP